MYYYQVMKHFQKICTPWQTLNEWDPAATTQLHRSCFCAGLSVDTLLHKIGNYKCNKFKLPMRYHASYDECAYIKYMYSDTSTELNPFQPESISVWGSKFMSVCNQNGTSHQLPLWLYERVWEYSVSQYLSQCVWITCIAVYIASNIYK